MSGTAPTPAPSQQSLIEAVKASIVGYNEKDWDAVRATLPRNVVYDEIATQRRLEGIDQVISVWKGWASAFPDSRATFHDALAAGNMACVEMTWRGTHTGQLELPGGPLAPTNRSIEMRACQVCEMVDGKPQQIRHYFDMATLLAQLGINL